MENLTIPRVTGSQMAEVDRLAIEKYGIQLIQMMENAGRELARLTVCKFLAGDPEGKAVTILAGSGGNGGGALVCARNLSNWGAIVEVYLARPLSDYRGEIHQQAQILTSSRVELKLASDLISGVDPELIIDGIIGYSLQGSPRGSAKEMILWANANQAPILALDLPSGLDATSGEVYSPAIKASATLTLALPKTGLFQAAEGIVGELYLADIGIPPVLYGEPSLNLQVGPLFQQGPIIRLDG